ncbi:hypothetical protein QQF64_012766 [Cirrhinus molitorella]|uniref:Transcription initiation factor TFIID component TAF4 C-terminal domain-containing protein n=1 Tax=Cirrhinus molitorella TaxID=172907 RepID=A0ABR3LYW6_9TELE
MQQQELAQMRQRDANLTALAAIGPRKKRKVDSPGATTTGTECCSDADRSAAAHMATSSAPHYAGLRRAHWRQAETPLLYFLDMVLYMKSLGLAASGGHGVAAGYGSAAVFRPSPSFTLGLGRDFICVRMCRGARAQGELHRFTRGVSGLCSATLIPNKSLSVSGNGHQTERE